MSGILGRNIRLSIFGESHGACVGGLLEGLPAGLALDFAAADAQLARRRPGNTEGSTRRAETDQVQIQSGMLQGVTTGAPMLFTFANADARGGDYERLRAQPRPSHADYPAHVRFGGANDIRGGGHFSGRLTLPMVFAGAVARQILARRGIVVGAHIACIGEARDARFGVEIARDTLQALSAQSFALLDETAREPMLSQIRSAAEAQDSVGGSIEAAAVGIPAGLGGMMFDALECRLAQALFAVPAVKGVEFGAGFALCAMRGSEANDVYLLKDGAVRTAANFNGGILGGLATGMPVVVRVAVKPTPSIAQTQRTLDLTTGEVSELRIPGRHDACIVPRAVPVVEAMLALVIADEMEALR